MGEFHFLRPWWLAALPAGLWLIWHLLGRGGNRGDWLAVVDRELQPHVLARDAFGATRLPLLAGLAAWTLATLALAGPAWERLPVPAFRSDEALVVALDLSRSMDAADVEPSRLARARLKLLSLLERRTSGQTALVVFSAHAFTVTPLTTDTRTIASLVNALSTDIMPSRGSYPEAGITRAAALLEQTGMTRGEILLITDAEPSQRSFDVARELRAAGYATSVLAVGTAEGAPIPESGGGFLTDRAGQVVVPQVDARALRRLAESGGGRFAQLTADDRDLDAIQPERPAPLEAAIDPAEEAREADVWRDAGVWLALALLPFAALGFRRGWIAGGLVCLALPVPRAEALEWRDLWLRPDQRGYEAMQAEEPRLAAGLFEDPRWRAAAEYRSGEFAASAATLAPLDTADAHYNRGNALARAGDLAGAIDAYERALGMRPEHEDARYNRDLIEELLDQQSQSQSQSPADQEQQSGADGEQQAQRSGADDGGESDDGQSGAEQSAAQSAAQSAQGEAGDPQRNDGEPAEQEANSDPEPGDGGADGTQALPEPRQAAVGPEDVEQWASDQAAEQWLRRIPQDPGGLLRRKFLYQYQRLGVDQDGNYVWPGDEAEPW